MDLDSRKLDELLELTRENNSILRSMRRSQRWSSFFSYIYWGIIIGSIIAGYYYIQPMIQKYTDMAQTSMQALEKVQGTVNNLPTDAKSLQKFLGQ